MKRLALERLRIEYPVGTIGIVTGIDDIGNILAPIAEDIARMNKTIRNGTKDAAKIISQTKNRILKQIRCGLSACDKHTDIESHSNSNFFTYKSTSKAFLVALQRDRYNPIPRILKYRRKHFRSGGSKESGKAADYDESDPDVCDLSFAPDFLVDRYTQEQKRLSDEEIRQIADRYSAGESTYELAAAFHCHRSTISRTLKKAGIKVSHKVSEHEALVERVLQMYEAFMRPVDIGKELDIGAPTIRKILHENGVRIRHSSEYSKK